MAELIDVGGGFKMLPPAPDVCQECAVAHKPNEPHNKQSLFYQYAFYAKNGRWPTWTDAMAHCTPEMRERVKARLIEIMTENDIPIPEDLK